VFYALAAIAAASAAASCVLFDISFVHEGWCYHHVQAVIVAIDQYAEAATGNREFFWNRPHTTPAGTPGRQRGDNIP
jgi:hypothetical protein